jgi:hypothetical protein
LILCPACEYVLPLEIWPDGQLPIEQPLMLYILLQEKPYPC